jgi:thermitase
MHKVTNIVFSAILSGMLLNAGMASAYSTDNDRDHGGYHKGHKKHHHHHHPRSEAKLLEPRSLPYALPANSGPVDVTFNVQLLNDGDSSNPQHVFLVQKDNDDCDSRHDYCKNNEDKGDVFKLNDQGQNGDTIAGDSVYSARVRINARSSHGKGHHKGGNECQEYRALALVGRNKLKSPNYSLCSTSFPVTIAPSNTSPQNLVIPVPNSDPAVANELLVRFDGDVNEQQIQAAARAVGAQVVGSILPRNLYQFRFPQALTVSQLTARIQTLENRPGVESAYVNRVGHFSALPDDPEYLAGNQHGYALINADDAWSIGADGSGISVAVLDSGVAAHVDLPIAGVDAINHGTGMAGIVGALTDNTTGVAGVAGNSTLQSVVVSADAAVTIAEMVAGFQTVAAAGTAQVVTAGFNITLAPPGSNLPGVDDQWDLCAAIDDVVLNSGTPVAVVISAAGNNNSDGFHYPSKCNDSSAPANAQLTNKSLFITVMGSISCSGACATDTRQADSNYGAWIDVAAPAVNLRSTNNAGGYTDFSGTSYASALVAGAAAQLLSCGTAVDQVQSRLVSTAPVMVAHPGGSKPRIDARAAALVGNTAPTGITGGSASINESTNTSLGHAVGTLATTDANVCDSFAYNIQGGADAASFSIGGPNMDQLILTAGVLDFETKSSYSVTVRVTDAGGLSFDQAFVINVNDLPEPTFTIYSVRATYLAALGGATVLTQNFDGFAHGDSLVGFSAVPGVTVNSNMTNIVAWDGTSDGDLELAAFDPVGNPTRVAGIGYYDILVTSTYDAIGFDITAFNPATPGPGVMQVHFLDGTSTSVNIFPTNATEQDPVFFGVTSSQPIASIRWNEGPEFSGTGNEETSLDDFAIANLP